MVQSLSVLVMLLATFCPLPAAGAAGVGSDAARVVVDGRLLSVNDQDRIPRGIFGTHAVPLTPERIADLGIECHRQIHFIPGSNVTALDGEGKVRDIFKDMAVVIDCQGDRYWRPEVLVNPDYEQRFRRIGREYAQRCLDAGWEGYVEFWNEPYLNWAERSRGLRGSAYQPKFYEVDEATDDGPVRIKGWDEPLEFMRWRRLWAQAEDGRMAWGIEVPEGLEPGDTFRGRQTWYWTDRREQQFTVVEKWHPYDSAAASWWSGPQNLQFYLWMFIPFAEAVREVNPDVTILAGWDYGYSRGDWAVWRQIIVPMLEEAGHLIDGLTEHHYGTDTRLVTAWYEVAVAHTMAKHDRWIHNYNTECGGRLDPAVHGIEAAPADRRAAIKEQAGREAYTLRDILGLLHHSPAKVGARTEHGFGMHRFPKRAFRLLRPLRGELMHAVSDDHDVWPVVSLNEGSLVIAVFNDAREDRRITLDLTAPRGTRMTPGALTRIEVKGDDLELIDSPVPTRGRAAEVELELGPRQAARLVIGLEGELDNPPRVQRRQFFAREGVLHEVEPDQPLMLNVAVDADMLAAAERAVLRLIVERVRQQGQARVTLNDRAIDIPAGDWTLDLPIDPSDLDADNVLRFEALGADYRICAASILLEAPEGRDD